MFHRLCNYLPKSIRLKTIITTICLLAFFIPLICISVYSYYSIKNTAYGNINQDIQAMFAKSEETVSNDIDDVISIYFNIISDPILNPELYSTLSLTTPYTSENVTEMTISNRLSKLMMYNVAWSNGLVTSVTYYTGANHYYLSNGSSYAYLVDNLKEELDEIYKTYSNKSDGRVHLYRHSKYDSNIIYYIRDFHRPGGDFGGLVILQIDAAKLAENYRLFEKYEGTFGILSIPDGIILTSTNSALCAQLMPSAYIEDKKLTDILSDSENYYTQKDHLEKQNLDAMIAIPMHPLKDELWKATKSHIFILFLCLCIMLAVCIFVPRYFSSYIGLLIQKMEHIRLGDYNIRLLDSPITEFNDLNHNFNYMSSEIKRLIHEVYESELLLKDAQIHSLQSQINPHFLFNILLCISWKARSNNDPEVSSMITSLSTLMRANIFSDGSLKTTIEKEIEICRLYLELQQYRFGERLQFKINMDTSIRTFQIPKLTIQPIVENAVVHGLEKKLEDGLVCITCKHCPAGIKIEVFDNGMGCPFTDPDKVIQSSQDNHFQIGLKNCNQRLKYLYGDQYGLKLESQPLKYTKVTVYLPLDKEDSNVSSDHC